MSDKHLGSMIVRVAVRRKRAISVTFLSKLSTRLQVALLETKNDNTQVTVSTMRQLKG